MGLQVAERGGGGGRGERERERERDVSFIQYYVTDSIIFTVIATPTSTTHTTSTYPPITSQQAPQICSNGLESTILA